MYVSIQRGLSFCNLSYPLAPSPLTAVIKLELFLNISSVDSLFVFTPFISLHKLGLLGINSLTTFSVINHLLYFRLFILNISYFHKSIGLYHHPRLTLGLRLLTHSYKTISYSVRHSC